MSNTMSDDEAAVHALLRYEPIYLARCLRDSRMNEEALRMRVEASESALKAEREACARVAEEYGADDAWHPERRSAAAGIAEKIRRRVTP